MNGSDWDRIAEEVIKKEGGYSFKNGNNASDSRIYPEPEQDTDTAVFLIENSVNEVTVMDGLKLKIFSEKNLLLKKS